MKNGKMNNGITLIALVVTIIILLILAGVTIGMATSGTGLFDKAKYSVEEYNNKQQQEQNTIAEYTNLLSEYITNNRDTNTNLQLVSANVIDESIPLDYTYTVPKNGKIVALLFSLHGNTGNFGNFSFTKNTIPIDHSQIIRNTADRKYYYYNFDVNEGDSINIYLSCSGTYGDNGYALFLIG